MKNIHLVPTEKPSRLGQRRKNQLELNLVRSGHYPVHYYNIYITSDDEIKEGDWTFDGNNPYKWTNGDVEDDLYNPSCNNYKGCKKIILTTDQELIKDGVQAIDDEFLEWFVKNPSCEEVEVTKWASLAECGYSYHINIPQGAKWQSERMYSEEEVFNFAQNIITEIETRKQNIISNSKNINTHLLEGGCMAFESSQDVVKELFKQLKNK